MIVIIYENAERVVSISYNNDELSITSENVVKEFWRLVEKFPNELIMWVESQYVTCLNTAELVNVFHHNLIMASYPINTQFLPEPLGYIDQSPFVYPKLNVTYPTWRMSTDVGGIYGEAASKFKDCLSRIKDFGYLINSIAKIGQQNSLFCYSSPLLLKKIPETINKETNVNYNALFDFVYQFYKIEWIFILLLCIIKYERKFPFGSFVSCFFLEKHFKKSIDLSGINVKSNRPHSSEGNTIDVIIPTLGRAEYVKQVLLDLKEQSLKPIKIIIVEQDPDPNSKSQLGDIHKMDWPFQIVHKFIHKTGACFARNTALKEVSSKWVFFADDDIRIPVNTLEWAMLEIQCLGVKVLNLNCIQPEGVTLFKKVKQWGAFGSGTAIVKSKYALQCEFSPLYEFGFGEDLDFGLQLRSKGTDVIYHPDIKITHLKAPSGGFREPAATPWEKLDPTPKPSPTMMLLVTNNYNKWMKRGYKVSLFIKFYKKQSIINPVSYFNSMKKRWELSEEWARRLSHQS